MIVKKKKKKFLIYFYSCSSVYLNNINIYCEIEATIKNMELFFGDAINVVLLKVDPILFSAPSIKNIQGMEYFHAYINTYRYIEIFMYAWNL